MFKCFVTLLMQYEFLFSLQNSNSEVLKGNFRPESEEFGDEYRATKQEIDFFQQPYLSLI